MPIPLFHKAHYNILAAQIKKNYKTHASSNMTPYKEQNRAIEELAVSLAERLKLDNPQFDPIAFLDHCSPDPELYPFSELWDEGA